MAPGKLNITTGPGKIRQLKQHPLLTVAGAVRNRIVQAGATILTTTLHGVIVTGRAPLHQATAVIAIAAQLVVPEVILLLQVLGEVQVHREVMVEPEAETKPHSKLIL